MQSQNDDRDLIHAALAGKSASWEKLVRRYERRVYNHCLRLTASHADALDLMQEVFFQKFLLFFWLLQLRHQVFLTSVHFLQNKCRHK